MITLKDVYKIYYMGDNEVRAADGINIHIEKGEFVFRKIRKHLFMFKNRK